MNTKNVITIAFIILFVSGCVVTSYHPLYTQKDLVFDESLLGTWNDEDGSDWKIEQYYYSKKTFQKKFGVEVEVKDDKVPHKSYLLHYIEKEYDNKLDTVFVDSVQMHVHMVKLGKDYYLDFYGEDMYLKDNWFVFTNLAHVHSFAKVEIADSVKISWFDSDWLKELIDQNKIKIKHEKSDDQILLTASTKELQKFIIKYGDSEDAYLDDEGVVLTRSN